MADISISSPDPLLLPSSPLGARSTNRQSSVKPRTRNAPFFSPAKSFIVDTGGAAEASPWRIKVTVQAEPRDPTPASNGSPAKRRATRRTTKVPLKSLASEEVKDTSDTEYGRPQRKRKGTPIRRRTTRAQPAQDEAATEEDRDDGAFKPPPAHVPTSSATRARRRRSLMEMPTQRGKRLSQAREELDMALQKAVGYPQDEDDMPGDMTLAGEEDFTMVSVETLQSMKADTSILSHRSGEGDRSALSVSYLPSSPPKRHQAAEPVQYPDIEHEADEVRKTPARLSYDAMSWKPTARTQDFLETGQSAKPGPESKEWRMAEETMNRRMEMPEHHSAIVEEDANAGAEESFEESALDPQDEAPRDAEEDIWQEEASRSLEEDTSEVNSFRQRSSRRRRQAQAAEPVQSAPTTSAPPALNDLFAGQVLRPPRAKIPRTWRRTSGADFAYSDSPAHAPSEEYETEVQKRRRDASTDGGSRASSGMLTPTSTDDEHAEEREDRVEEREDSDISLTRPDGEGTMMEARRHDFEDEDEDEDAEAEPVDDLEQDSLSPPAQEDIASPFSDASSSSVTSPDGEDTGMFFQSNLPSIYHRRPQRARPALRKEKEAVDLSEVLRRRREDSQNSSSHAAGHFHHEPRSTTSHVSTTITTHTRHSPLHMRPVQGRIKSSPSDANRSLAVSSPLRKSLLRSSKVRGSPGGPTALHATAESGDTSRGNAVDESIEESWQSKASDQRQLLHEMNARRPAGLNLASRPTQCDHQIQDEVGNRSYSDHSVEEDGELSCDDSQEPAASLSRPFEPSQSYEEHLNLESPQKIRVKFGDSANSSLLVPRKEYPPLFGPPAASSSHSQSIAQQPAHSPPTVTLVSKRQIAPSEQTTGIFSRLSTNFWSAVVRPTGPTEIMPSAYHGSANVPRTLHTASTPISTAQPTTTQLRAQLRSRYGVLPSTHPWTMTHMRTLHRMLNSLTSGKSDSIIPTTGAMLSNLQTYVNKAQVSVTGFKYLFTASHARVIDAFCQVLVPADVVRAMRDGEVEELGDETARSYRGEIAGRHGDDLVWGPKIGVERGEIGVAFLVRALGDVVRANEGR